MSRLQYTRSVSRVTASVRALTKNLVFTTPALSLTRVDVGGVMQVRLNYPTFKANIGRRCLQYDAGTITLNTADVPAPTNHYVVIPETTGAITVTTTDPEVVYGRNNFAWLALVRLQSIAGTELVFYLRRMYTPTEDLLNEFGDYASDVPYTWVSGAGLTIDPLNNGSIDLEATVYRRMKFASTLAAQTDAPILLDDEATVVLNLESIITYSDGSAITPGSYHKIALLLICSGAADVRVVALRQNPPPALTPEYATLEEARVDANELAATVAPISYYAPTFPLAYVYMQVADSTDLGTIDLREPGFGGGGGGGGAVGDHSLLVNLGADDHLQYLNRSGVRAMTGDLNMGGQAITNVGNVDGVDISAHVVDATAHNNSTVKPIMPYAMASDSTTQAIANVANAQVLTFNTSVYASGITRTSASRYTIVTAGTYLITFSGVASLAALPADKHLEMWLRVDGVDVTNSNTRIQLTSIGSEMTLAVSFLYKFTAGQYFELWTWGDDTDCRWLATAAAAGPTRPAVPSLIMTVNMVSRD